MWPPSHVTIAKPFPLHPPVAPATATPVVYPLPPGAVEPPLPSSRRSEQLEGTNRVLFRATSTVDEWEGPVDAFMGADEFLVYTLGGPAGSCMHSVFNELLTFAAVFPNEVCERSGISVLYDDKELRAHLATKDGSLDTKSGDERALVKIRGHLWVRFLAIDVLA